MIHSMTGYAAATRDIGLAILHLELKSVNSRYFDINFRLAEELRFLEMPLRELISARVSRGKIECRASLTSSTAIPRELAPDQALLTQLGKWQETVRAILPQASPLSVAEALRWSGVLADQAAPQETLQAEFMALAALALDEFLATRSREGAKLAAMIAERVARMRELLTQAVPLLPVALAEYQERLAARLREVLAAQDEERIRQEIGLYATRIDVAEELSRLTAHLGEVERVLKKGGAAGKRLDFLMQELNREANTLASKSVSSAISGIALELKLLIEQMREQIQNLE